MELIISLIVFVCIHSLIAMYIDKLRFVGREHRTNFALIPFCNVYLLGRYAFDVIVGIVLFVGLFFVADFSVALFNVKYGFSILSGYTRYILFVIYFLAIVCILFYVSGKYNRFTNYKDRFDVDDIIYYVKETFWILVLCTSIYFFAWFVVGVGTGTILL